MSKPADDHVWRLIRLERTALADDVAGLTDSSWHSATLCGAWDVEHVVAHLTAAASTTQRQWLLSMLRSRFRPDVHNERMLRAQLGRTPAETLERFRAIIPSRTAPSSDTVAFLGEVVVHAEDIRHPLGIARTPDLEALTPVAEFFARRNFAVPSRTTAAGLTLTATDGPFAAGTGPVVRGGTLALVMAMAGRPAFLDVLDGPGVPTLRARLNGGGAPSNAGSVD